MADVIDVDNLKKYLAQFAKERDWEQFHSPKNLSMALSVEASELVEIFQWLTNEQSVKVAEDDAKLMHVKEEVADIFTYLVLICKYLNINLHDAVLMKRAKNEAKYPVELAKGNAKKYNEF